ncbi:hypothetical protein MASR2M66_05660 [Chloroflexota bacterium]
MRELYKKLRAETWIDPWLDEEKLLPGQAWHEEIEKAVEATDVVVVLLSNRSVSQEGYVQRELKLALDVADEKPENTIFITPLRLDDCPTPRRLKGWHYVDYFPASQKAWAFERLIASLKIRAETIGVKTTLQAGVSADEKARPAAKEKTDAEKIAEQLAWRKVGEREIQKKNIDRFISKNSRSFGIGAVILFALILGGFGLNYLFTRPLAAPVTRATATLEALASTKIPFTFTLQPTDTPIPAPTLGIGSTRTGEDGMVLVYVPAGEFTMGSAAYSDEQPRKQVNLDAFWIDRTEVTNAMYARCVADHGACAPPSSSGSYTHTDYYGNSEFDNYPVIYVDWHQALAYCAWAGRELPSEAQWEKAARGTDGRTYPWGNESPNANFLNYNRKVGDTTQVGNYPNGASIYGALDMSGNVWEWVSGLVQPYPYDAADGREDLTASGSRTLRGGSWVSFDNFVRSAFRGRNDPSDSYNFLGFRCSLSQ